MTHSVPPYFGSYEELVDALILNPFLGSGRGGRPYQVALMEALRTGHADPQPSPWLAATSLIMSAIGLKEFGSKFPDGQLRNQFEKAGEQAISDVIDDYCGTGRRPGPGPHPWVYMVAAELTALANSLPEGSRLREQTLQTAGQLIQRAFGVPAEKAQAAAR